jgi:hypothetical protein
MGCCHDYDRKHSKCEGVKPASSTPSVIYSDAPERPRVHIL